jgi:glycosyltransferase involved in cell wall biosynthesis
MRVALFAPHFAEYATRLAIALAAEAKVLLFLDRHNCRDECNPALLEEARNVATLAEFDPQGRGNRIVSRLQVIARMQAFRPDVIHVQEQADALTTSIVRLLGRRRKLVLTVHDPLPHRGNDSAFAMLQAPHIRELRDRAEMYHVHGAYCREALLATEWNKKPVVSTAHGIILVPRAEERMEPEPGRVLLFGRMEEYKGVGVLAQAAEILRSRAVPFRLVLAGRGPEAERMKTLAGNHEDIEVIARFLTPAEAVRQFQLAAVVVAPYHDATQSGVVAASFGNGRPVVASRIGGLADSVAHGVNGLLTPPNNPVALADALEQILQRPELRSRLTEGAREAAMTTFSWADVSRTLMQAYC